MNQVTVIFLAAVLAGLVLQLWLAARQAAHIIAHRDRVPPAFVGRISGAEHAKAASYSLARLGVERLDLVLSTVVLLVWTLGGGIDWLDARLAWFAFTPLWQGVALVVGMVLVGSLVDLPLSIWRTFRIEQRFGFNRTTPAEFAKDHLLSFLVTLVLGVPLVAVILWLMGGAGSLWWLWAWLVWMGFTLFVTWAYPIWIAPLFNRFRPLDDDTLRERLENLLARCGFRSSGMFVMDGSRRSAHGNAYFTGFGSNKRIVFYDTLLDGLDGDEIEAVLAHELGHFKRRHIVKMLSLSAVVSLLGLALLGWLSQQAWFYHDLGVSRISPATALALFMLVLPVFTLFLSPLSARLSRRHEFEADDYAAEQTDPRHLINGLVKMYRDNASTLTPDPLYSAFYHSHPPAPVRVAHLEGRLATDGA
ncbi:MAG: M48 family metallopeptidase [Chromatiaceae bacterium]|nr:M48 family metallopeptidase [Gammaproteobacteria bacterium]MCP5301095.1 M48 family metallopeptidase [Chromatiaceae bacterium]MCP5421433.1 M48 family metallopeptidase [Chromatiaceae bacterium]